jgi:hypothetical protein
VKDLGLGICIYPARADFKLTEARLRHPIAVSRAEHYDRGQRRQQ